MPVSCHFRDCEALLFTSLLNVQASAISSIQAFTFTFELLSDILTALPFGHVLSDTPRSLISLMYN